MSWRPPCAVIWAGCTPKGRDRLGSCRSPVAVSAPEDAWVRLWSGIVATLVEVAHRHELLWQWVVYKFICKNEKRAVTTDEWLESDVLSGMWRCLDAEPRPGTNHSLHNL